MKACDGEELTRGGGAITEEERVWGPGETEGVCAS